MLASSRTVNGKATTYTLAELLGEGQFGKVYRGHSSACQQSVAIKIIRRNKFLKNDKLKQLLQREMAILSDFEHQHVIKLLQVVIDKQEVCIVYEYCDGGTLEDKIPIPQEELAGICGQIFDAMMAAEQKSIIHRDIKPANILFKNGKVKIADWGFSRFLENGETTCSFLGSPAYMAPEALKGYEYSQKADLWSLGIVLFESLTGTCPWKSHNIPSLMQEMKRSKIVFPKNCNVSDMWKEIITDMLSLQPNQRPSCRTLKQKLSKSASMSKSISQYDQSNIMSCVFFLQIVQWSRKQTLKSSQFELMIRLIEQNLLKIREATKFEDELIHILEKQIKVVSSLRKKVENRSLTRQKSLNHLSSPHTTLKTQQDQENPQGIWQQTIKKAVRYVIDQLQIIYEDKQAPKKEEKLIRLNVMLDLIAFSDIPNEYLQKTFESYLTQLGRYNKKVLLKLINYKLQLVNKRYYQ